MDKKKLGKEESNPSMGELISLKQAAEISGLTPRHIRLLVSRGTIWGEKLGRDWFTTAQVITEYMACNRRPGPKSERPK